MMPHRRLTKLRSRPRPQVFPCDREGVRVHGLDDLLRHLLHHFGGDETEATAFTRTPYFQFPRPRPANATTPALESGVTGLTEIAIETDDGRGIEDGRLSPAGPGVARRPRAQEDASKVDRDDRIERLVGHGPEPRILPLHELRVTCDAASSIRTSTVSSGRRSPERQPDVAGVAHDRPADERVSAE